MKDRIMKNTSRLKNPVVVAAFITAVATIIVCLLNILFNNSKESSTLKLNSDNTIITNAPNSPIVNADHGSSVIINNGVRDTNGHK